MSPKTKLADISNAAQLQHSQQPPTQKKIAADFARRIFIVLQLNNRPVRGKILLLPPTIQQKFFWENALSILEKAPAKCAEAKIIFLRSFYIKYFFRKNFPEKNPPDKTQDGFYFLNLCQRDFTSFPQPFVQARGGRCRGGKIRLHT